jgi:hypothetical protein
MMIHKDNTIPFGLVSLCIELMDTKSVIKMYLGLRSGMSVGVSKLNICNAHANDLPYNHGNVRNTHVYAQARHVQMFVTNTTD